jgi:nitric oxide dioxygenase
MKNLNSITLTLFLDFKMSITEEQKQIVKSTASILKENGKEITSIFYKHLFQDHPELLNLFNQTNQKIGTQPLALANTVYFAAENIDNLEVLMPQVQLIAYKHRALTVLPEHYPIVGKYLLHAIDEFLGDKATSKILDAWSAAYDIIASIFINIEKQLYDELGQDERDKGFISLTIVKKEKIANGPIVSLTFERRDGGKMHDYHSGQYITLRIKKGNYYHNRHYSLIQPFDGKTYCIAIKQEIDHEPKGIVSNEIIENYKEGDKILATLPAGTFTLVENAKHHLFIAGGIGITVLSSMIQELHKQGKSNTATLIHCVPTEGHAAFSNQMCRILPQNQYHLLLQGKHLLQGLIHDTIKLSTHVYLCGPVRFMNKVEDYLAECHHPSSHIHTEVFQPSLSLIKNAVKDQSNTKAL